MRAWPVFLMALMTHSILALPLLGALLEFGVDRTAASLATAAAVIVLSAIVALIALCVQPRD